MEIEGAGTQTALSIDNLFIIEPDLSQVTNNKKVKINKLTQ